MPQFQTQLPVDTIILCASWTALAFIPIGVGYMFSCYSAQQDEAIKRFSKTVDATASLQQENAVPVPEVDRLLGQADASLQDEAHGIFIRAMGDADVKCLAEVVIVADKYKAKAVDVIDELITKVCGNPSLQGEFKTKMDTTVLKLVSSLRDDDSGRFLIQVNTSIAKDVEQSTRPLHDALANSTCDLEQAGAHDSLIIEKAGELMTQIHALIVEDVEPLMIRMLGTIEGDVEQLMTELQPPIISGAVAGLAWIFTAVYIYRRYSL